MTKYRNKLLCLLAVIAFMWLLTWGTDAVMQRTMVAGLEFPLWLRILFSIGVIWKKFWLQIILLIVSVVVAKSTLKAALQHHQR